MADYEYPVPPRHVVKWEKRNRWQDEATGEWWESYRIRLTCGPVPEGLPMPTSVDDTLHFCTVVDPADSGKLHIHYETFGIAAPVRRKDEMDAMIRSGELPNKREGEPFPRLTETVA